MSVSQAPQPEQAPVAREIPSKSATPLSISFLICPIVVPLQLQIRSLSGVALFICGYAESDHGGDYPSGSVKYKLCLKSSP